MLENAYKSHHKTLTSHRAAFLVISCNLNTAVTTTQDHRHWLSAGQLAATWAEGTLMAWLDPPPVSSFPSCLCRGLTALLLSLAALSTVCQAIAKGSCKFRCRERGVWVEDVKFWGALKSFWKSPGLHAQHGLHPQPDLVWTTQKYSSSHYCTAVGHGSGITSTIAIHGCCVSASRPHTLQAVTRQDLTRLHPHPDLRCSQEHTEG